MAQPPSSPGDPEGRRIAYRRAQLLSEAGAVARVLEVLLKRANFDARPCSTILKEVARQEAIEIQRSLGRIESRKRFKSRSGQPLLEGRPLSHLCLDECGKSAPEPETQPQFFALAAIAMDEDAERAYVEAANAIKSDFFGRTDLTFHEPMMRDRDGPYLFRRDVGRQKEFDNAIDGLVRDTPFTAFGVGVRKVAFQEDFVATGVDPYLPTDVYAVSIQMLLERYIDYLATRDDRYIGRVTFESQGPREDAEHQLQYALTMLDGTQWVPQSAFWNWLESGCRFTPKCGSHPTELADMFSRDIWEWIRHGCTGSPKRWDLFGDKIYCRDDGLFGKFGLKIFPDSDIRERTLEHRQKCGAKISAD